MKPLHSFLEQEDVPIPKEKTMLSDEPDQDDPDAIFNNDIMVS
jgi:hypothetical protein